MTAKLVVSFDFELGWGVLDSQLWREREAAGLYLYMRKTLDRLFKLLEERYIPTTWAMVSSMGYERESDLQLEHLPDSYRNYVLDFFRESKWETRCAVDLMEKWHRISQFSEVCSHSSTHIYAEYPDVSVSQYTTDMMQSINHLQSMFSCNVTSLILPRDQSRFMHGIARMKPLNIRLNPAFATSQVAYRRTARGTARLFTSPPVSNVMMGAMGEIYQTGSLYFNWSGGRYEQLKKLSVWLQQHRVLNQLRNGNGLYHVWLHPFNLAESDDHYRYFVGFLKTVTDLRDKGFIEILTMADIGSSCLAYNEGE